MKPEVKDLSLVQREDIKTEMKLVEKERKAVKNFAEKGASKAIGLKFLTLLFKKWHPQMEPLLVPYKL